MTVNVQKTVGLGDIIRANERNGAIGAHPFTYDIATVNGLEPYEDIGAIDIKWTPYKIPAFPGFKNLSAAIDSLKKKPSLFTRTIDELKKGIRFGSMTVVHNNQQWMVAYDRAINIPAKAEYNALTFGWDRRWSDWGSVYRSSKLLEALYLFRWKFEKMKDTGRLKVSAPVKFIDVPAIDKAKALPGFIAEKTKAVVANAQNAALRGEAIYMVMGRYMPWDTYQAKEQGYPSWFFYPEGGWIDLVMPTNHLKKKLSLKNAKETANSIIDRIQDTLHDAGVVQQALKWYGVASDDIKKCFDETVNLFTGTASRIVDIVSDVMINAGKYTKAVAMNVSQAFQKIFMDFVTKLISALQMDITQMFDYLAEITTKLTEGLAADMNGVVKWVENLITGLSSNVQTNVKNLGSQMTGEIKRQIAAFKATIESAKTETLEKLKKDIATVKTQFRTEINAIKNEVTLKFTDLLNKLRASTQVLDAEIKQVNALRTNYEQFVKNVIEKFKTIDERLASVVPGKPESPDFLPFKLPFLSDMEEEGRSDLSGMDEDFNLDYFSVFDEDDAEKRKRVYEGSMDFV